MPIHMDHIVLNVNDDDKMMLFYTEVMKFTPERLQEYRSGKVPFPSVRINTDTIIDLFPKALWSQGRNDDKGHTNLNHFCIDLDKPDWDRLCQRLRTKSIPIEQGPINRWGAHGTGISIYFCDPENNLIEARYYEQGSNQKPCLLDS